MSRLMRLCCLCLLVLALPLQGLAAVAWLHGSPGHGPALVVVQAAAADDAAALPPCHGHQATPGDPMGGTASHNANHDASSHPGCSACAACGGHGTAPPAAMPQAPRLSRPVAAPAQRTTPAVAPWVTEAIERPPRA